MPMRFRDVVDHSLFSSSSFRWRMGVRSLAADEWLQPDDHRSFDLHEKDRLTLRWPGQTFVALPGSESAGQEVCALVEAGLGAAGLALRGPRSHPLETAGLSVQEDLCLLERQQGVWMLTAASVCFPTRWDVPSKLGRSVSEIHDPVPRYRDELATRVDRFFDRMVPGSLAHRLNWSLVGDPARRLSPRHRQAPTVMPEDPARALHVRIERQTLRRLDQHDAIVFGIRVHVWPLGEVLDELPAARLADEVETMPVEVARYKDLSAMRDQLVVWLRQA